MSYYLDDDTARIITAYLFDHFRYKIAFFPDKMILVKKIPKDERKSSIWLSYNNFCNHLKTLTYKTVLNFILQPKVHYTHPDATMHIDLIVQKLIAKNQEAMMEDIIRNQQIAMKNQQTMMEDIIRNQQITIKNQQTMMEDIIRIQDIRTKNQEKRWKT